MKSSSIVKRVRELVLPTREASDTRKCANVIESELVRMGVYHVKEKHFLGQTYSEVQRIRFIEPFVFVGGNVRIFVDVRTLPHGIRIADLGAATLIDTISQVLGRTIRFVVSAPHIGCYYEVSGAGLIDGIQAVFSHADVSRQSGGSYVAGMGRTGELVVDLFSLPHLLIGGATRQGKSVHLWHIFLSLCLNNSPASLKFYLFDLKSGVMFWPLRSAPHVAAIADDPASAIKLLEELVAEMRGRYETIRESEYPTVQAYNVDNPDKAFPILVILVDELASITQETELRKDAAPLLTTLLRQAGGAGMHVVLATQNPRAEVVNSDIRANVTEAMAFRCAKRVHSEIILGTGGAEKISVPGRAIFRLGGKYIELQCPLIVSDGNNGDSLPVLLQAIKGKWGT